MLSALAFRGERPFFMLVIEKRFVVNKLILGQRLYVLSFGIGNSKELCSI